MDANQGSAGGTPIIVAIFENLADAEYGLDALQRTADREDVSLIVRDPNAADAAFLEGDTWTTSSAARRRGPRWAGWSAGWRGACWPCWCRASARSWGPASSLMRWPGWQWGRRAGASSARCWAGHP